MLSSKNVLLVNRILDIKYRPRLALLYQKRQLAITSCILSHTQKYPFVQNQQGLLENTAPICKTINKDKFNEGPGLEFFIANSDKRKIGVKERHKLRKTSSEDHPYLNEETLRGDGKLGKSNIQFVQCVLTLILGNSTFKICNLREN